MICLESTSSNPYFNLAMEEYVFSHMDYSEQYLMLWQNSNTIVVGKYQNTAEEINQAYVDAKHIKVARRLSGGGAVYHDTGNLNYTLIVNQGEFSEFNFQTFVRPVIYTLQEFGISAEFNGRNDLTIEGKKFSGSSQYAKGGRLLHHGCIMLDSNLNDVACALKVQDAKIKSKGIKSMVSRVTTINEHAPSAICMDAFKSTLIKKILSGKKACFYELTAEDICKIQEIADNKYSSWEWNYGFYGTYELRKERKFPSGLVTVMMNVKNARIEDICLRGDFFGNGDIEELESLLIGLPLDNQLETALDKLDIPHYISGISAKDFRDILVF